jgi:hypothetical protein
MATRSAPPQRRVAVPSRRAVLPPSASIAGKVPRPNIAMMAAPEIAVPDSQVLPTKRCTS